MKNSKNPTMTRLNTVSAKKPRIIVAVREINSVAGNKEDRGINIF